MLRCLVILGRLAEKKKKLEEERRKAREKEEREAAEAEAQKKRASKAYKKWEKLRKRNLYKSKVFITCTAVITTPSVFLTSCLVVHCRLTRSPLQCLW